MHKNSPISDSSKYRRVHLYYSVVLIFFDKMTVTAAAAKIAVIAAIIILPAVLGADTGAELADEAAETF